MVNVLTIVGRIQFKNRIVYRVTRVTDSNRIKSDSVDYPGQSPQHHLQVG